MWDAPSNLRLRALSFPSDEISKYTLLLVEEFTRDEWGQRLDADREIIYLFFFWLEEGGEMRHAP